MIPLSFLLFLVITPIYALVHKVPNESEREMGPLVRYDAPEKATASIILLHGIGNSSDVFRPFPPRYHSQERFRHINFLFPNAPIRNTPFWHNAMGGDPNTRSWFNSSELGMDHGFDETQLWEVVEYIHDLVKNETLHGISPERIIAGGFSQGGMEAFGAIADLRAKIGGFLIFSRFLLTNWTGIDNHLTPVNKKTPIFHGNGLEDPASTPQLAVRTANWFKRRGFNYHLHLYPGMGHQTDWEPNDEDVEEWVAQTIPKKWHKWTK